MKKVINGVDLKSMFISGGNNLYNHYPEVDALNVFPVPDGDTGMNMNLTLTSGAKEISNRNDIDIFEMSKAFSKGLLMGARGNSGVITSQIFRGFSQGLEGKKEANAVDFSNAFEKGVEVAYKAVMKPVEGTILTVVRESSAALKAQVKPTWTIDQAMDVLINEAKKSLDHTPELLPILKEVGVIDSGGFGLTIIFDGMKSALDGKVIERNAATATQNNVMSAAAQKMGEEEFGYCTEFIMILGPDSIKKPFKQDVFTKWLNGRGNSLVVVKDEDVVKVHVHTMTPGSVLNYAQQYGEFKTLKIENMTEQHHALETGGEVNEHVDLVEEPLPESKFAMIAVSAGEGIDNFFKEIGVKVIVGGGQTMNPSTEDFVNAIKKSNSKNIILLPNNSNIVLAANQAAELYKDDEDIHVVVVPSKTIPQGITASIMFNPDASLEENKDNMTEALGNVISGSVTFAIRDTEIDGVKCKKDEFIGIMDKKMICSKKSKLEALNELLEGMITEDNSIITILTGEDVTEKEIEEITEKVSKKFPDLDLDIREGNQPVYSFLVGVE